MRIGKWSAAALLLVMAGGAGAEEGAQGKVVEEIVVAAPYSARSAAQDALEAAKLRPATKEVKLSAADLKIPPPKLENRPPEQATE